MTDEFRDIGLVVTANGGCLVYQGHIFSIDDVRASLPDGASLSCVLRQTLAGIIEARRAKAPGHNVQPGIV